MIQEKEEKRVPTGSLVYLLHCHYKGNVYSFIGNRQTFGDFRSTTSHFDDISFMFLPPIEENSQKNDIMLEYYLKVLKYYPGVLNTGHADQVFLNSEKRSFIEEYRTYHCLNNIKLNDDNSIVMEFVKYNKKIMKEIKRWEKKDVSIYDVLKFVEWIQGKDLDKINALPRFMWFDEYYRAKIEELGLLPPSESVLKAFMIFKDNLINVKFIVRLQSLGKYGYSERQNVVETLKSWKVGRYYTSKKRHTYKDMLDYISKFMFVRCNKMYL